MFLLQARVPAVGDTLNHLLWLAHQNGVDRFFTITDKTYVLWYRLFPILALAYLLSTCGGGRRACASAAADSLLALMSQAIMQVAPPGLTLETVLILGGLPLQWLLAAIRDRLALKKWQTPAARIGQCMLHLHKSRIIMQPWR